ncbi:flagellar basal body rod protein FlgG [Mahella australiensis]|uniref:Flagellar hook-basal body protein n=1 Tax=Mahella australiensis (strain DSM 15567 / CIP 107919 / 50-1 BON) TaxID=697281 RepID=F4A1U3_MAHA5|nr:flagellar basal body rod protein FlgG [Mahella australiensis]AEE96059.1 flagellar hook-basal body protein [Mahella australiensis 50-1 BON]
MMRSMFSGVSGLRAHQTRMDVIGNNIANVNTVGFKSSRVTFQDVFNQTIKTGSAPNVLGGTNPQQIGLGAAVGAIDVLHTPGGIERTDNPLDLAINGDGFFVVNDGTADYYTRAGNFHLDADGNLVTPDGMYVQTAGGGNIIIDPTLYVSIVIDKTGQISGIQADGTVDTLDIVGLAKFVNPGGLEKIGQNMYRETISSGPPATGIVQPGQDGTGYLTPGALEMSNVDLSRELTDMIITQRGFQANSRVITTSDEMLQELVNLKR